LGDSGLRGEGADEAEGVAGGVDFDSAVAVSFVAVGAAVATFWEEWMDPPPGFSVIADFAEILIPASISLMKV